MVFKSGDVHTSVTMRMGFSFPISPAGMVRVVRVPVTSKPSIVSLPKSSVVTSACFSEPRLLTMAMAGGGGASERWTAPDGTTNAWRLSGFEADGPGAPEGTDIFSAVLSVKFRVYDTCVTGSTMKTKCGAFAAER